MQNINEHPMDEFPVRPLTFAMDKIGADNVVWSRSCPEFSVFLNALGLHIPYFERYLIRSLRNAKEHIAGESLRRDISAIIGQEAHHAKNFVLFNQALAKKYPKAAQYDREASEYFVARSERDSLKVQVGFTAGYETFTFLSGMIILQNYDKWFADSDPVLKALWVWHQVEEVEHGAVAFDVYKALYGEQEWYRKWMVLRALMHIAAETTKTYAHMVRVEGWLKNPLTAISKFMFLGKMVARLIHAALPVFTRSYHPRRHPIVTTQQNHIQMAWRRFAKNGGDVLEIDHQKMTQMMKLDAAASATPPP